MRKWFIPLFLALAVVLIFVFVFWWCSDDQGNAESKSNFIKHEHVVGYIDPSKARLNENFHVCDESRIFQYYNPREATYSLGKNGLRNFILENYQNKGYNDSGYLIIRFVINCKGNPGRYVIHENDLDLRPNKFNPELVEQLFQLTSELKKWNPNFIHGEYRDSYMFINYRIENGNITEMLP